MRSLIIVICMTLNLVTVNSQNQLPPGFAAIPPLPIGYNTPQPPSNASPQPPNTVAPPIVTKKQTTTKAPNTQAPTTSTPAPTTTAASPTQTPNCGLNVNVAQNPNCLGGNSAVQQTLSTLKQELDRARLQQQAQTAAVQGVISSLQTQQSGYLKQIADLQNEVKNLVLAFNSKCNQPNPVTPFPTTASPSTTTTQSNAKTTTTRPSTQPASSAATVALQQSVLDVRSDLTKIIQDFNHEVFNLSTQMHDNQLQESRVHQMIETQIVNQGAEIGRITQQVGDLNKLLLQLQSATSTTAGAASTADVKKLTADIQKVAQDLANYDQTQQAHIAALSSNTSLLIATSQNNSAEIQGLRNIAVFAQAQLNQVQADAKIVHDALGLFRQQIMPQVIQLEKDVHAVNLTSLESRVNRISSTLFQLTIRASDDRKNISALELQTTQLKADVLNINGNLTAQAAEIRAIKNGIVDLKTAVPIQQLNDMNNAVLTILSNSGAPNATQLNNLKTALQSIVAQLTNISIGGSTTVQPSG